MDYTKAKITKGSFILLKKRDPFKSKKEKNYYNYARKKNENYFLFLVKINLYLKRLNFFF